MEPVGVWNVQIECANCDDFAWNGILRPTLLSAFSLASTEETRETEAFLLVGDDFRDVAVSSGEVPSSISRSEGALHATRIDFDGLASVVGDILGANIGNVTKGNRQFDLHLSWDPADRRSLIDALAARGLHLIPRKNVERFLVITNRSCNPKELGP
jgi:hypothetical protein